MTEPVSWLLIRPGWRALAADGGELGHVEEVAGDSGADVWDGLSVATGPLARPRYVPAEQVAEITPGHVRLALTAEQFEALGEYEEPPTSAELSPEKASILQRAESAVEAPTRGRDEQVPLLRRILLWLGLKRD